MLFSSIRSLTSAGVIAGKLRAALVLLVLVAVSLFVTLTFAPLALGFQQTGDQGLADDAEKAEFFENKIRPVLAKYCYKCHAADSEKVQGGLLVDSRKAIRDGGESGPGVVPGKPSESLILEAIRHESFEMPPDRKLPDRVIKDFEKWIADGAVDPREDAAAVVKREINLEEGRKFWSLQPLVVTEPPAVSNADWPRTTIDRFVLARMEQAGLQPAADAEKLLLLRRVYFDLIGLPPTPAEIESYLSDDSDDALKNVVDRLLDSPHFGERWGRHWLDVARYADSSGGGRVLLFPDAWRYRDYVIAAYNQDKPFNRFVIEQVAGDLLPYENLTQRSEQLTATGFLMLGAHNYELQDKELLRMEVVDEQINVVSSAMLGLTLSCARCHDHKFDPIPTTDYYALAGIFRSTNSLVPGNVSGFVQRDLPLPPEQQTQWDDYQSVLKMKESAVKELEGSIKKLGSNPNAADSIDPSELPGLVIDDAAASLTGTWTESQFVKPFVGKGYRHSSQPTATATYEFKIGDAGEYEVLVSHTASSNRPAQVTIEIISADGASEKQVNQQQQPAIRRLFNSLGKFRFQPDKPAQVVVHANASGATIIDAVQLLPVGQADKKPIEKTAQAEEDKKAQAEIEARTKDLRERLDIAKKELEAFKSKPPVQLQRVMSVEEAKDAGDFAVCLRGDVHHLGEPVPRGALSVMPLPAKFEIGSASSGRLELAQWLARPDNPLTARVYVNRVWQHLLGSGLVRTPDNFGAMGQRPTHPELLDYLAQFLIDNGYSTKSLIREIVLSRVYRLSVESDARFAKLDPENRLRWRGNRRRLDAESIRDAILAFSGQLDLTAGGLAIKPGTNSEFGYTFDSNRRGVYLPVFRNTWNDLYEVFDFPNPNLVSGKRNESTLPTQALFLMNSQFVVDQSRLAAEQLLKVESQTPEERIRWAYLSTICRPPTPNELDISRQYLQQFNLDDETERRQAWAGFCQSLISCIDFRYIE